MKTLRRIFIVVVVIAAVSVAVSLFLPSSFRVEKEILIKAAPETIFPYIDTLRKWQEWTVWNKENDSTMKFFFSGPTAGEDAVEKWISLHSGNCTIRITESKPPSFLTYDLQMDDFIMGGKIYLINEGNSTKIKWAQFGDLGWDPASRYFLFFFSMEEMMAPDLEIGLEKLKNLMEKKTLNMHI